MKCSLFVLRLWLLFAMCVAGGCSSTLNDYQGTRPQFHLEDFFQGRLQAYGMVQDRSGRVLRRFSVDLTGHWQGNTGKLEEDFLFDDGEIQRRVWRLEKLANGRYRGTADDVQGSAIGESRGFAFNWRYTLSIEVDGKQWDLHLDDWIYQLDESRVINRTAMTKWGIRVGEITLVIEKVAQEKIN